MVAMEVLRETHVDIYARMHSLVEPENRKKVLKMTVALCHGTSLESSHLRFWL